ncbi:methyl-accepting chemotaxis protein [Halopseudomonas pachastrellae]|nr:methyl-accepting chemotaxis protein [Halopseudomonas pachastrellae]
MEEKDSSNDPFASLLGVTTSNSNEATDPGADYKRTLLSLLNRYPGELERTSALIVERAQLQSITGERIDSLQAGAAQMRPALTAARDGITSQVRNVQLAIIGLIIVIALLIERSQRALSKAIGRFAPVLSTYAEGDFTQPVESSSRISELKQLELAANQLRQYLIELVTTINQQAEALRYQRRPGAPQQPIPTTAPPSSNAIPSQSIRTLAAWTKPSAWSPPMPAKAPSWPASPTVKYVTASKSSVAPSPRCKLVQEVQASARTIDRMVAESDTIGGVLQVIQGIAEQTNLLALNAAIEGRTRR